MPVCSQCAAVVDVEIPHVCEDARTLSRESNQFIVQRPDGAWRRVTVNVSNNDSVSLSVEPV